MSVGSMGMVSGAAGSPLAQSQGSEVDRDQQDTANQARQTRMSDKAEQASGVGQTEQDEQTGDRDADGRRLWELAPRTPADAAAAGDTAVPDPLRAGKDPTGSPGVSSTCAADRVRPLPPAPAACGRRRVAKITWHTVPNKPLVL